MLILRDVFPYISRNMSFENLVLNQDSIFQMNFFKFLKTFLPGILLVSYGEMFVWTLPEVNETINLSNKRRS